MNLVFLLQFVATGMLAFSSFRSHSGMGNVRRQVVRTREWRMLDPYGSRLHPPVIMPYYRGTLLDVFFSQQEEGIHMGLEMLFAWSRTSNGRAVYKLFCVWLFLYPLPCSWWPYLLFRLFCILTYAHFFVRLLRTDCFIVCCDVHDFSRENPHSVRSRNSILIVRMYPPTQGESLFFNCEGLPMECTRPGFRCQGHVN